jgi:hypothetical protein
MTTQMEPQQPAHAPELVFASTAQPCYKVQRLQYGGIDSKATLQLRIVVCNYRLTASSTLKLQLLQQPV